MIVAIIQARMGSSRLPGKAMLPLADKPILGHVISRVKGSMHLDDIIVATTNRPADRRIIEYCADNSIKSFCGSEDDVLDRFYQAAKTLNPDHIVRITADCPIIDPSVIDTVISAHLREGADYSSNTLIPTYPDGEDVEIFKRWALEAAWKEAKLPSDREHVTPYLCKNPYRFKLATVKYEADLSDKRWTIDEEKDYLFLKEVFAALYPANPLFSMEDVLRLLSANPSLENANNGIVRNEGYMRSLEKDKRFHNKLRSSGR
jgi:spore coat polysaccharide biosynthesis protein SpsF